MRFVLTIEFGNDAMQTFSDLRQVLHTAATKVASGRGFVAVCPDHVGDNGALRDENGNRVGGWHIEESK